MSMSSDAAPSIAVILRDLLLLTDRVSALEAAGKEAAPDSTVQPASVSNDGTTLSFPRGLFTTIRPCRHCGVLMVGGPTACLYCASKEAAGKVPGGAEVPKCAHPLRQHRLDRVVCADCGLDFGPVPVAATPRPAPEAGLCTRCEDGKHAECFGHCACPHWTMPQPAPEAGRCDERMTDEGVEYACGLDRSHVGEHTDRYGCATWTDATHHIGSGPAHQPAPAVTREELAEALRTLCDNAPADLAAPGRALLARLASERR